MNTTAKTAPSKTRHSLIASIGKVTAAVVALGALANALVDLYRMVGNIPVAPQEKTNHELFAAHFGELPLFSQKIAIKQSDALVDLVLEVYAGADILVKYGGVPQWFRAKPPMLSQRRHVSFVASAYAQVPAAPTHEKATNSTQAIIRPSIVLDLDKAMAEPSRAIEIVAPTPVSPNRIERAYLLARTKDDHRGFRPSTRTYTEVFQADPGYRIVDHQIQISSASRATITSVARSADGLSLTVTYTMSSGPLFDQWRGWIKGTVQTTQAPAP